MCGIIGFNFVDKQLLDSSLKLLKHRGPDSNGYYFNKLVTLGHTRLSIIDLSKKGHQPMSNEDKSIWITFNGEIFNFEEIKIDLISKGHKFRSKTDTEVLIHGYEEYGFEILNKLNGQFAFCIYDNKKKIFFLARDRLGINPLYYYIKDNKFIFTSELKVILKSGIKKEINEFAFNFYLMYGYTPRKQTIINDTFKIEPGHYLVYDLNKNKVTKYHKYWSLKISNKIKDEKIASKLILEKLDSSVKKRIMSDVPVGAFLSGGVDSSAVVALMSKYVKNLNTFSVKFDHDDFDESKYAKLISKRYNTKHHVVSFSSKDVRKIISKLAYTYDEPFGDSSMIPTYLVSSVARKHVTVSLSGDGGDELFGGYSNYLNYRLIKLQKYYPKFLNRFFYNILKNSKLEILQKPITYFEIGMLPEKFKFARLNSYLSKKEFFNLTGQDNVKVLNEVSKFYSKSNYLTECTFMDLNYYLSEDILVKVDRSSLANSLESRPPILDHELVELAFSIDSKLKIKGNTVKYILKKSVENLIGKEIINRKKQGFGVPLKYYLRHDLKDLVNKYVFEYNKHNYFKSEFKIYLKSKLNEKHWEKDYSRIIWSIMMFNMWYEEWFISS